MNFPYTFVLVTFIAMCAGCEPKDVRPGLWLGGEEVTTRVADWTFTDKTEEVFIETRPWYFIPHSTTIWCVQVDGNLYIGSYGNEPKTWEVNLERDAHARIRIHGKIYRVAVTRITDEALTSDIDVAYNQKYDMAAVFGSDVPEWWFYRVEQI